MGESRYLFERGEDALGMSILGVHQEFNIIGFDRESCLFDKVFVNCVEPPHKEFCSLRGVIELGVAVLVGLVEVRCCTLIASIRLIGSSEMHSQAVTPRKGRGVNTGSAMFFRMPVAAAAVPEESGGGVVSVGDAPL